MWGWSLPWHKVLNAVVAELSIYKLKRTHRFSVTLSFTPERALRPQRIGASTLIL